MPTKPAKSEFRLTENFLSGYQDKLDPTEAPSGSAASLSKNFSLGDDGKWVTRPGSEYLGTKDTLTGDTTSSGRLRRRDGTEIPVVAYGTRTKYLHPLQHTVNVSPGVVTGTPDWALLEVGFTDGQQFGFASSDLSTSANNNLVMCNAAEAYRIWNGAIDIVSTWTSNSITTASSTGLAAGLFGASGTIVLSNGSDYRNFAYTSITSSTFNGVTPDPNNGLVGGTALSAGMAITQIPTQYASNPKGNVLLSTDNARILVANTLNSTTSLVGGGQVYGSKTNDPTDFTFSTPRVATDGFVLNISEGGGTVTGMVQQENINYILKPSTIKRLTFSQDGDDVVQIQSLSSYDDKTSGDDGSISALSVFRGDNSVIYVTPNNVVHSIRRVERVDYPLALPISDAIKDTTDVAVFDSETAGISWKGRIFISTKKNSDSSINDMLLIYNERYQCWETPTEGWNISSFFVSGGNLYGTLANSPDVIQLWTGTSDFVYPTEVDIPINAELRTNRETFGSKVERKTFDKFYIEGEMLQTGTVTFSVQYNENGDVRSGTLQGTESGFFYTPAAVGGFGTEPFGVDTFGPSGPDVASSTDPVRFRLILTTTEIPFYNYQFRVTTSSYFKLIAYGPNVSLSKFVQPAAIYKAMGST